MIIQKIVRCLQGVILLYQQAKKDAMYGVNLTLQHLQIEEIIIQDIIKTNVITFANQND
ncbi:hypothetical protein LCGC14_1118890 [marine sediment metagenome]|uniref:Uncharacterized protein n=1 Tax=marine sediment metagenome TaxID=412755 RepID=A0A0F9M9F8_9ZZZZ